MGAFNKMYLTTSGQNVLYKAQMGKTFKFTKFKLGDGEIGSMAIAQLTDLISSKKEVEISKLKVQNNKITIGCNFTNKGIVTGFYFRELGLFVEDPDTKQEVLFLYGNSRTESDYIPAEGVDILEKFVDIDTTITDVANITAIIDESLVYISITQFNQKVGELEGRIGTVEGNISKLDGKITSVEELIKNIDVTITSNTDRNLTGILKGNGEKVNVATEADIIAAIPNRASQWDEGGAGTGEIKQELELLELELVLKGIIDESNVGLDAFMINMANPEDYVQTSGYFDSTTKVAYI